MQEFVGRDALLGTDRRSGVLLATAGSGGTIAAVRHLASSGFDVRVMSSQRLGAAAWSRNITGSYAAPSENNSEQFLQRLLDVGAADPGRILLPTSDETAWLYTEHENSLKRYFRTYQPSISTLQRILDKRLLEDAASKSGLAVLPSWDPRSMDELTSLAPTLCYPVLIKPRTHVHRVNNDKGIVVNSKNQLISEYQRYVDRERVRMAEHPLLPAARLPIIQSFVRAATEGVQSLTGFIDRSGELYVTRRSVKVFQRSPPIGVGVCFESMPTDPALSSSVRRLCRELGYFGIFEVEFLSHNGHLAVIDFNPRMFNQLGMDIHRGMPLPLLACLDAIGDTSALQKAVTDAQSETDVTPWVFCDRFTLRAILIAQAIFRRDSHQERARWYAWMKHTARHTVDVGTDPNDHLPGLVHAVSEIYLGLKALPRFLRAKPNTGSAIASVSAKAMQ